MKKTETKRTIRNFFFTYSRLIWGLPLLLLTFVSIAYGIFHYYQTKPRNIFDEIYYVEKGMYPQTNTILNGIKGISTRSYVDSGEDFRNSASESYDEKYLPTGYTNIGLSFYFKNPETFVIAFEKKISDNVSFRVSNKYFVKEKKMKHKIVFNVNQERINDSKQIADLRKQYNITDQILEQYNKEILNDFFLRDWCKVYDSQYTPNDWGEVKVEKGWE